MKFLTIACLLLLLTLPGCAQLGPLVNRGAEANDRAVQAAEFTICNAASVGSIRRAYGDRVSVWQDLCARGGEFAPDGVVQ